MGERASRVGELGELVGPFHVSRRRRVGSHDRASGRDIFGKSAFFGAAGDSGAFAVVVRVVVVIHLSTLAHAAPDPVLDAPHSPQLALERRRTSLFMSASV